MENLDYVILGSAQCFFRNEENKLVEQNVVEPIPSATFLCLIQDVPSSYSHLAACQVSTVLNDSGELNRPSNFPADAILCADFNERLLAAARTYEHNPAAKVWQTGQGGELRQKSPHKRVLNATNKVSEQDNVKQHPLTHTTL